MGGNLVQTSHFEEENVKNTYKLGLDAQREAFKTAKHENNYDSMCDAIENIKSEIKTKCLKRHKADDIKKCEKICDWYRLKETSYIRNTPEGKRVVFPPNFHYLINQRLTIAYEILIEQLAELELL